METNHEEQANWATAEVERLRAENERLRKELRAYHTLFGDITLREGKSSSVLSK